MSRSKDHARAAGKLLTRARRGDELKLRAGPIDRIPTKEESAKSDELAKLADERAQRGEKRWIAPTEAGRIRFGDQVADTTILAYLEHLDEERKAGRPLSEADCDWLMDVAKELVLLPVRSGATSKKPEEAKAAAIRQGRQQYKKLRKEDNPPNKALSITKSDLNKNHPGMFVSRKKGELVDWSEKTFKDQLTREPRR